MGCIGYYAQGESNIDMGENDAVAGVHRGTPLLERRHLHGSVAADDRLLLQCQRIQYPMV